MLSSGRPAIRVSRHWRAPLSLGLGVPLLLGSSPAAAAGAGSVFVGSVTTWIGMLAALLALLAPRRPGDVAGAAAVVVVAGLFFVVVLRRRQRERSRGPGAVNLAGGGGRIVASLFEHVPRAASSASLDGAEVLEAARSRFLRLQAAWDAGDVQTLGHLTTPDMLQELLPVLSNRVGGPSRTDVITLHATLLDVEELGAAWLASVEFSGLIRESAEQGAVPFRELWMLAAAKDGAPSWRLARQQALL
ncbi:MAG TPA: Tim44-like domain-containing protein [Caldimonas sp.]|nr:Tim44-like domain-containing protein [Caldimonas sp.]